MKTFAVKMRGKGEGQPSTEYALRKLFTSKHVEGLLERKVGISDGNSAMERKCKGKIRRLISGDITRFPWSRRTFLG